MVYPQKKKVIFNTIILALMFILIGYTSFMMLVVRSNANVPINENAPKDALSLKAYLGGSNMEAGHFYMGRITMHPLKV
jgi:hypothetical protein